MTIIAVGSGPGSAPVGLVRCSGPDVRALLATHVSVPEERHVIADRLRIDSMDLPCTVLCMPGPRSYTGEDVVELLLPGNSLLLERVVAALVNAGLDRGLAVAHAAPGEFTFRAWQAGNLQLHEAESVMQLVHAASAADLQAAHRTADGELVRRVVEVSQHLAMVLALVEAGIDFADEEDVVLVTAEDMAARVGQVMAALDAMQGRTTGASADDDRPTVRLRGVPSAGKSTLFNAMLGRHRAVTMETHHTTRDELVEPHTLRDGRVIRLVDSPGITGGEDNASAIADVDIWCVPPDEDPPPPPAIVVHTKADVKAVSNGVGVSAHTGEGMDALDALISAAVDASHGRTVVALSQRQRSLVQTAIDHCERAQQMAAQANAIGGVAQEELVAANLRAALDALGAIAGDVPPDDVLGLVFSSFCIGK